MHPTCKLVILSIAALSAAFHSAHALPAFDPAGGVGARMREANAALDGVKLDADGDVGVLDLWKDFTSQDGTLKTALCSDVHLHLAAMGHEVFAEKLERMLAKLL